jgi:phospholipase C
MRWRIFIDAVQRNEPMRRSIKGEEMSALENIDTFVVLMLENRSFDHMLGYLSLSGSNANGLSNDLSWLQNFTNDNAGKSYPIHRLGPDVTSISDPPHDRAPIAKQINSPCTPGGCPELGGFVQSYATSAKPRAISAM